MDKLKFLLAKYLNELYLGGILFLSIFLRFDHISLRPLWLDEADVANLLSVPLAGSWSALVNSAQNATYFYALRAWSLCFGNSEISIRSLSVFFSVLSVVIIYKFGTILNGKKTGLWAAFLLSINYFSIFYAIQARQYSLVILLSILSYYCFYNLLVNFKKLAAYVIFTVLGVYSHPWFILIMGSQFIYLLFNRKYNKKIKIIFSQILIFILSTPWLIILWNHKIDGANNWIELTKISTLFSTFHYFMYGATVVFIIGGIVAFFLVFGRIEETETMINYKFNNYNYQVNSKIYLLLIYLFFPLLVAVTIGSFIPFYEPGRYEAVVLPAFILLFAYLWSKIELKWLSTSLILLLIIFSYQEVFNEKKDIQNQRIDNRTSVTDLLTNSKNGDWLVFTGLSRPPIDYYLTRLNSENKIFKKLSFPADMVKHQAYQNNEELEKNIDQIKISADSMIGEIKKSSQGRVWLVFTQDNPVGSLLEKKFRENFTLDSYLPGPSFMMILYTF